MSDSQPLRLLNRAVSILFPDDAGQKCVQLFQMAFQGPGDSKQPARAPKVVMQSVNRQYMEIS
jgi:hypothetical protein